jgi:hypothetical protein
VNRYGYGCGDASNLSGVDYLEVKISLDCLLSSNQQCRFYLRGKAYIRQILESKDEEACIHDL